MHATSLPEPSGAARARRATPLVSIVIAACNTERYIGRALQSVLTQTERRIEVIVADDGSADDTVSVVRGFDDRRITLLTSARNHGQSHARNRALQRARGEWIGILDSDDWYAPQRLARLLETARAHEADLIADDLYLIQDGDERPWGTLFSQYGGRLNEARVISAAEFVLSNLPGKRHLGLGSAKPLMRRGFLARHGLAYDETLRCGEDFALYLACLVRGARFIVTPQPYYFYRSRRDSVTSAHMHSNFEQLRQNNLALLPRELIRRDAQLLAALTRRLAYIEQRIDYHRIMRPLKKRAFAAAVAEALRSPRLLSILVSYLPNVVRLRVRRRLKMFRNALWRRFSRVA